MNIKGLPKTLNICGFKYKIEYTTDTIKTDIFKRDSIYGQIDYVTRTMRIYIGDKKQLQKTEIINTILHEMIHGITTQNPLLEKMLGKDEELFTSTFALLLTDTLIRNNLINIK